MTDHISKNLINGIAADYLIINDRAIHYGDGIFETILCCNNSLYFWLQHYQRLKISAERLELSCPDEKTLLDDIAHLLEKNQPSDDKVYAVKIILTRGTGERGYRYTRNRLTDKCDGNRLVSLSEIEAHYSSLASGRLFSGELCQCRHQASINEDLAGLKHLNRLENVLARNEWGDQYIDGVMLNANKHVIEGTMSNLFAVKNNRLYTPDLSLSGIKGIMRDVIIQIAEKNNIQLSVINISIDELIVMDELFISNSLIGMKSVNKLGDSIYTAKSITEIIFNDLLRVKEAYVQAV